MRSAIAVFVVFPILLISGLWTGDVTFRAAVGFAAVCIVSCAVFVGLGWSGRLVFAVLPLDIILILMIFKGDLRIR